MQNSQTIQAEIQKAQERKAEVESQLATAREALKKADDKFVTKEISFDELVAFQSGVLGLERAAGSIQTRLDGLAVDYKAAIKDEALEVFKSEAAEVLVLKAKIDARFTKAAAEASQQIEKIVEGLTVLMLEDDRITDRVRAARRNIDALDKALGAQAEAQHRAAFMPGIRDWSNKFTGALAFPIVQMVSGYQGLRSPAKPARATEQTEAEKRLRPDLTESRVAQRFAAQTEGAGEPARRLGRS